MSHAAEPGPSRTALALRWGLALLAVAVAWAVAGPLLLRSSPADPPPPPAVRSWYGDRLTGGARGTPQRWINVPGEVVPGDRLEWLTVSLNGGERAPLAFSTDNPRLTRRGEFNVQLDRADLRAGDNELVIRAHVTGHRPIEHRVVVDYRAPREPCPLPYAIDWRSVERIDQVAHVVDGRWQLTAAGVRTSAPHYDRALALGDVAWRDVDVTATAIVHGTTPPGVPPNDTGVAHVAIALRWPGHRDDGHHPSHTWYPLGATAELRLEGGDRDGPLDRCRWRIFDGDPATYAESARLRRVELLRPYRLRHRVRSLPDGRTHYQAKAWAADEAEPRAWDLERIEAGDLPFGAVLLIAHHADVTFSDVRVVPSR